MRKIIISIPTIKYIDGVGKINVQREVRRNVVNFRPEGSGRKGDNCRIKKKDTGEVSFIYRNKNKDEDPFITL